jgi:hypothetical protein
MTCDNCEDKFDCYEPCKQAIGWKPLEDKYYVRNYRPVGININYPLSIRMEKSRKGGYAK